MISKNTACRPRLGCGQSGGIWRSISREEFGSWRRVPGTGPLSVERAVSFSEFLPRRVTALEMPSGSPKSPSLARGDAGALGLRRASVTSALLTEGSALGRQLVTTEAPGHLPGFRGRWTPWVLRGP